ncbi:MAG: tetratricopeptide repeat protein [Calditrichaeota bacterium]|nr:tetratricopeptide repeat protein [Calditrichota bacterium]MCB9366531.1 tetratricopeptide repeat protein [Calditrichota bacterium]MCB9391211.1 tetratricopeptide repeat protein [Calditrichota bacterium]
MSKAAATRGGRLSKSDLKHDKLVETAAKAENYYHSHKNTVWMVAVGILALVVIIIGLQNWMGSSSRAASYDLMLGKSLYGQRRYAEAQTQLQSTLSSHGGTTASEAQYYLARIKFDQGDFTGALAGFESCLSDYSPDADTQVGAEAGAASSLEALGRAEEAAQRYEQIAKSHHASVFAAESLNQAGRIYLSINQKDKAIAVLDELVREFPESQPASRARTLLGQLR